MQHAGMHGEHQHHAEMPGAFGPYPATRDASGTSWVPDSAAHQGIHLMKNDWTLMVHGNAEVVYDSQEGSRGADKTYSSNMLMLRATRPLGPGRFGFHGMVSAEPLTIGRQGYPLLLQTGETADGRTPLIDRQHPHDMFMELAVTYTLPLSDSSAVFGYFGVPGEPATGPPAFVHRFSGEEFPAAPITHHWLDSTHVQFGVATLGYVHKNLKFEASVFKGREPDELRFNIDAPKFDSYSFRASYNPTSNWALQASMANIRSREELTPNVNTGRVTLSAIYNRSWDGKQWQSTFAWGRNIDRPVRATDAYLLESTVAFGEKHTLMARLERTTKDELFLEGAPLAGQPFTVGETSFGYIYDFLRAAHLKTGLGGLVSASFVPAALKPTYGGTPISEMIFLRFRLR